MKQRENYTICSCCGYAFKQSKMFFKAYKNTAIFLCKKCAKDLSKEIQEHYDSEIVRCKDCVLKYKSNDGETYCHHSGMPIKPNGYCNFGTKGIAKEAEEK